MKRIFLAVSMVTLFAAGAAAQGISGGVKAGLNVSSLTGDDADGYDMKIGYHFGGYAKISLTEAFSIQPELLYNAVGAKSSEGSFDTNLKVNYITVPVMLGYSFGKISVQAGPQIGFLTSAKMKIESGGDSAESDVKDQLKGTDFGVNVGLGAEFGKLNAAARYCFGLSNIADSDDADIKNGVIQLSLGYKLFGK